MKGKRSTFLKSLKRKHSKTPRHVKMFPNSTKVGQGDGYVNRNFDVTKKRSEQLKGGFETGKLSNYALMLKKRKENVEATK